MDFPLHVDLGGSSPRHRQVYDAVRAAILGGRLRPGDRLPPTRGLAEQLSISRTTVAEAYDQLEAEGYIHGKSGSGTYVAPNLPEEALQAVSRAAVDMPGAAPRSPRLSTWGRHVSGQEYDASVSLPGGRGILFDFRAHAAAADDFPWDAWEDAVARAVAHGRSNLMAYPPAAGHAALREAIASHIATYRAVECSPEQIVIVNGSLQGLNLLSHLLVDGGEAVAVEDPGYPKARLAFEARGLVVDRIPVDRDGMVVEHLGTRSYRMVHVTASHQEPTGATMSLGRRLALLEWAERVDAVVLEDDYDSEFRYEGRPVESLQGLDRSGLVVYAGTFSKSVLAGLRIGFLVPPSHLVEPLIAAKSLWDSGAPMLEQAALAEFMASGAFERHIRRTRRLYRGRRDALVSALRDVFGGAVRIGDHHGGLNVLVALDVGLSEEQIVDRASRVGIRLVGASAYFNEAPPLPMFLLGFAAMKESELRAGVVALGEALVDGEQFVSVGHDESQRLHF